VIVTIVATLLYGAFVRAFLGYRMWDAAKLTMTLGLVSQVVIVLATVLSYLAGIESYFPPPALNQQAGGRARRSRSNGRSRSTPRSAASGALLGLTPSPGRPQRPHVSLTAVFAPTCVRSVAVAPASGRGGPR
jgi:hypothetical protein